MRFSYVPGLLDVPQRLSRTAYDGAACRAALRGEQMPSNLGNEVARLCLVRGIRHHAAFARSPDVAGLAAIPGQGLFARARNARLIMSDEIPPKEAMQPETYPYCIWHPAIAKEDTYRELAQRYPAMRYQVGRACAVAGYSQLYRELDLLPDVSIAEEARENRGSPGARDIFEAIMAAIVRYRVMDDATRTVKLDKPEAPAFLNADTVVLPTLAVRRKYGKQFEPDNCYLNITEDCGIDEETVEPEPAALSYEDAALLAGPLPLDLPSMNKKLLILCAAVNGNVDRYARLRRRDFFSWERSRAWVCLAHGCYQHSAMAAWLASSPGFIASLGLSDREHLMLRRAMHARRVMDGVADHLLDPSTVPDAELPYWIWHPIHAPAHILERLAAARPAMRPQCVRACIAADYRGVYGRIMDTEPPTPPDRLMMDDARAAGKTYYCEDLKRRQERLGLARPDVCTGYQNWMDALGASQNSEPLLTSETDRLRDTHWELYNHYGNEYDYGFYDGFDVSLEGINFFLSSPEEYKRSKLGLNKVSKR
ncbi:hypothetical protein C7999DRAFT_17686 [Corynascus novoguineensis]|uniref:Uncharacterized protein n=1 Tax=Corynascus novoguineensis TaxID=1126955 RepID=A0AAN7HJ62_9PEZI|nr:hypothetical protein C7999DRAFT_17686 [Corynascus novoguineensis]